MKTKALVVLSGGQDSTTCLFWAKQNFDEVYAITFDYGQRHVIEINAARKVAKMAGVIEHEILKVSECLISTSPLLSDNELEQYESFEQMDGIIGNRTELTFVPMRNPFFLTIAVNMAVALGCRHVVTGICQEDNANYPDCREAFRVKFQSMVNEALFGTSYPLPHGKAIAIDAPLMFMSKAETVELAKKLPGCWEALAYSHTSYDGKYPPTDMNHANVLRAHGFEKARLPDPLVLRAFEEGLMELPETENYDSARLAAENM